MWKNGRHPPMPPRERAKQFLPFAAVVGLEDALKEKERIYDRRVELSSDMEEDLDRRLHALSSGDRIRLVHFFDGRYVTEEREFLRVDTECACIVCAQGDCIPLANLHYIEEIDSERDN